MRADLWGALKRTVKEFREDNLTDWAAALTYYSVLAIFPALIVLVSILGLATVIEPWIAAAAVGAGLLVIAGILALTGKKEIEEATPPKPEQTIESVQRDVDTVKARARS